MSKTRDALRVPVYQPRNWGIPAKKTRPLPEPWWGLDTERNTQPGADIGAFVCGWISDAAREYPFTTFTDLNPGTYWVHNVAYDIEGLVRDLGKDEGWAMREDGTPFQLGDAKCVYFHGKRFEYTDIDGRRVFLESSSFFNRIPLMEAAKTLCVCKCEPCLKHKKKPLEYQHCGSDEVACPTKDPIDASKMSLSKYQRDKAYRRAVDKYCAKDARIVYRLMRFLDRGFRDLNVYMGGTPGSTARRFLRNVPPFPKVIWTTHRSFLETYCGGRFEIVKRGVFHDAKQYDIISAYPKALSKCPMLTDAATHSFTRRVSDNALYGAYEIAFKTDEYLGVMPGWRGNTRVYSKAEKRGWICKPELDWLQNHGYDYTIHRGVEVFDENATNGWEEIVVPLFNQKEGHLLTCSVWVQLPCNCGKKLKGQPMGLGAKVGVNSLYGILIQLIEKGGKWVPIEEAVNPVDFAGLLALEKGAKAFEAGQFYAPVYSATLTSMVRTWLLETAVVAGLERVVAFHTDSLLTKDGATIPVGTELGNWSLEKEANELVILKSGQYAIGDAVKGRGFSKRKLNPDNEDEIAIRHKSDLWATSQMRRGRIGVKTARDWRDVSVIREKHVGNNVSLELKRKWEHDFSVRQIERMIGRKDWMDSEALQGVGKVA